MRCGSRSSVGLRDLRGELGEGGQQGLVGLGVEGGRVEAGVAGDAVLGGVAGHVAGAHVRVLHVVDRVVVGVLRGQQVQVDVDLRSPWTTRTRA